MAAHVDVAHRIRIGLGVDQTQRLFTPAGEELWIDHWAPAYLHPADGVTQRGMVFTTGEGAEHTIWTLADYVTGGPHHARYVRVTPGSRTGFVQVDCEAISAALTEVTVRYTLTALAPDTDLHGFQGEQFAAMIDEWKTLIDARLDDLRDAPIR